MSKKSLYLLGIVLTILLGSWLYPKFCCNCCNDEASCEKDSTAINAGSENLSLNGFKLNGTDFDYQTTDNFKFLKGDFKTLMPISDSVNSGIDKLKLFFEKNPNQKLMITGYATSDEKNTSAFPNLGFARANDLKNYFISKGFPASKFDLNGEIKDKWSTSGDTLLGPADFKIITLEENKTAPETDWNSLKEKINANPLVLYFNTGQAEINLTAEERQKVADLVHYLDNVEGSKLNTVGHTDNAGKRDINIKLGLERANFAKEYLVKNGVATDRIDTSSKGPDEPIADNATAEGKAKNRRTVVTIK
jgi:OOP family OmpA-OmpF porin